MTEDEPTRKQYLILSITQAIQELSSAIWTATSHDEYTAEQLENYMQTIAEMHLIKRKEEEGEEGGSQ